MYRSSPFRSTLNTNVITVLDMCKICTEADRFEQNPAAGQIFRKRPAGQITPNRPAGQITPNRPAGQITLNRPAGQSVENRPAGQTGWLAGIKIVNEIRAQCNANPFFLIWLYIPILPLFGDIPSFLVLWTLRSALLGGNTFPIRYLRQILLRGTQALDKIVRNILSRCRPLKSI